MATSTNLTILLTALGPILFGSALLFVLRQLAAASPRRSAEKDVLCLFLAVGARVMILIGVVVPAFIWLGILPGLVAVVVFNVIFHRRRCSQQQAFLWALAVAAERLIPLVPVVEAFAAERWGVTALRARRLAQRLREGCPLPKALEECPGLVSPEAQMMMHIGHQCGALGSALRQVVQRRDLDDSAWGQVVGKAVYLCILMLMAWGSAIFISLWIFPSLSWILSDFGTQMPAITRFVFSGLSVLQLPLFVGSVLIFCLAIYVVLRYMGWIRFGLPMLSRLTRQRETAHLLEALALVAQQQRPIHEGIATLAVAYPRRSIRRRLARVARDVDAGADWCERLVAHGLLGRADQAVLQAAQRVGNLPWALREMADSNRRRATYRLQLVLQFLFPLVSLVFGLVVAVIVVGIFMPLVSLITQLA